MVRHWIVLSCFSTMHVAKSGHVAITNTRAVCTRFSQQCCECDTLIFTWWGLTRLDGQTGSASGVYWTV